MTRTGIMETEDSLRTTSMVSVPEDKNLVRTVFQDARGKEVRFDSLPQKIIPLVPSLTETLFALGAGEKIVAVTRFCKYPKKEIMTRPKIGGVHDLDRDAILSLGPDLIIADREENRREDIEYLAERVPVYLIFPRSVGDAQALIRDLGQLLGATGRAQVFVKRIEEEYQKASKIWWGNRPFRTFYPLWYNPYYSMNGDTYTSDFLAACGAENICADREKRYFPIGIDEVLSRNPEVILLPSEPFKFREKHRRELLAYGDIAAVKNNRVYLVNGEMICWWGVRMIKGFQYLTSILWKKTPTN
jgi:ABC-type Fe3+-hydroxamate transport system substrate-binding protein